MSTEKNEPTLTPEEVAAREQERAALVETLNARSARFAGEPSAVQVTKSNSSTTASRLRGFAKSDGEATVLHEAARREKVAAIVGPIESGVAEVIEKYSTLRNAHLSDAVELANLDLNATLPAIPLVVEPDGLMTNRQRVVMLTRTACELEAALKYDADVQFADMKAELASLRLLAQNDPDRDIDFQRGVSRLNGLVVTSGPATGYVRRAQEQIATLTGLVRQFTSQKAKIDQMLEGVERLPVEARPKAETLPAIPEVRPSVSGTSYSDFDPREPLPKTESTTNVKHLQGGGVKIGSQVEDGFGSRGKTAKLVD